MRPLRLVLLLPSLRPVWRRQAAGIVEEQIGAVRRYALRLVKRA